jgi:hypothetical protein
MDDTIRELFDLEKEGWKALSSSGAHATRFYGRVLDDDIVMLLPGGVLAEDRDQILDSMSGTPWSEYRLSGMQVLLPNDDTGVVVYRVEASRKGSPGYAALVSSIYVRRKAGWRLLLHQQTPI